MSFVETCVHGITCKNVVDLCVKNEILDIVTPNLQTFPCPFPEKNANIVGTSFEYNVSQRYALCTIVYDNKKLALLISTHLEIYLLALRCPKKFYNEGYTFDTHVENGTIYVRDLGLHNVPFYARRVEVRKLVACFKNSQIRVQETSASGTLTIGSQAMWTLGVAKGYSLYAICTIVLCVQDSVVYVQKAKSMHKTSHTTKYIEDGKYECKYNGNKTWEIIDQSADEVATLYKFNKFIGSNK